MQLDSILGGKKWEVEILLTNFHTRNVPVASALGEEHLVQGGLKRALLSLTRRASGEPTCLRHGPNPAIHGSKPRSKRPLFTKT